MYTAVCHDMASTSTLTQNALNTRRSTYSYPGANTLISWEVDFTGITSKIITNNGTLADTDLSKITFRVIYHNDATLKTAAPPKTLGLLATAHIKRVEALAGAQDEATRRQLELVVFKVLDAVRETVDNAVEQMVTRGTDRAEFQNTAFEGSTPVDAIDRTTLLSFFSVVANQCNNAPLAQTLIEAFANPEAGRSSKRARVAESALLPMARLAHTQVEIDPDKIPRYERDLHYADSQGRDNELQEVLDLCLKALASETAAKNWNKIVFPNADLYGVDEFENLVISDNPFPSRDDAGAASLPQQDFDFFVDDGLGEPLIVNYIFNLIKAKAKDEILFVGMPDAQIHHEAPVLLMGSSFNSNKYAVGTAAYPFIEAIILASSALYYATSQSEGLLDAGAKRTDTTVYQVDQLYTTPEPPVAGAVTTDPRRELVDISTLTNQISMYKVGFTDIIDYLTESFVGWHHTRCLEPRQTAHAVVVSDLAENAVKHFVKLKAVRKLEDGELKEVFTSDTIFTLLGTYLKNDDNFFRDQINRKALDRYWIVLDMLSEVDTPVLVRHPTCYVQGPGPAAVPTVCEALAWWCPTEMLEIHADELINMLPIAINDLPRSQRLESTVAHALESNLKQIDTLYDLCLYAEPVHLARVLQEINVYASVRADGGKRYRHLLGVNASIAALNSAVRHLLKSRAVKP